MPGQGAPVQDSPLRHIAPGRPAQTDGPPQLALDWEVGRGRLPGEAAAARHQPQQARDAGLGE